MATMNSASTTSVAVPNGYGNGTASRRKPEDLAEVEPSKGTTGEKLNRTIQKKYRHVAAVHSKTQPSCLSHDSDAAPSFVGFRNLMVIVLGTLTPHDLYQPQRDP